jgi:hypothetical protein
VEGWQPSLTESFRYPEQATGQILEFEEMEEKKRKKKNVCKFDFLILYI